MSYANSLLLLTGVLALSMISPGPNFAIVTSTAIHVSRRAGVIAGLGLAAASTSWTLLTLVGLGFVIAHAVWLFTAIRVLGALYLIFLGAKMLWQARAPFAPSARQTAQSGRAIFRKAYFVSMTNPKSAAFYSSVLTVMLPLHAPLWFSAAIIAIATLLSALWYCGVAFLLSADAVRRRFAKTKAWFDGAIGVILMALGVKLLVSR
ncbi:MAG TPA: LysE family transporter [Rhizomicrobium sp.]|jgi:RhtB (resistance to homoserine/threonine) family protein|nr:LysE family transporter [Rhizomicrobium sp.]